MLVITEIESERLMPELPEPPRSTSACTVRMALRKMLRTVSVSSAASMAASKAGRKLIACWLPARTSSVVSRSATSLRTAWESRIEVARRANVELL